MTVHGNTSSARGAVYLNGGTMLLENTTVTGNGQSNTIGGGVANSGGNLTLRNVTIADNVRGGLLRESGVTSVQNSILASGCVPAGQFGAVVAVSADLGHNLDEDNTCGLTAATKVVGQGARLAPVNANGGATPDDGAAVRQPGDRQGAGQDCTATDQRGEPRQGGLCDIGAFEAVLPGQPSATTETRTDIGVYEARFVATVGLAGEAGKLSFEWGLQPDGTRLPHARASASARRRPSRATSSCTACRRARRSSTAPWPRTPPAPRAASCSPSRRSRRRRRSATCA